jgi:hypothetical protein
MKGCLPGKQCDILSQYLAKHKEDIFNESQYIIRRPGHSNNKKYTRNLFLPISRGGMGCDLPVGFRTRVTKEHRMLATIHCPWVEYSNGYPLNGYPLTEIELLDIPVPMKCEVESVRIPEFTDTRNSNVYSKVRVNYDLDSSTSIDAFNLKYRIKESSPGNYSFKFFGCTTRKNAFLPLIPFKPKTSLVCNHEIHQIRRI